MGALSARQAGSDQGSLRRPEWLGYGERERAGGMVGEG